MKAYFLESLEKQTRLELREVALPEPAAHQMLVRMRAAGLNRGEFIAGHGLTKPGAAKPAGGEGAGEIVKLGAGVTGFAAGERVMGRCPGAFAEYALMDAREAIAVPARLSWEEAAGIPLTFMVVHDMLIAQGKLQRRRMAAGDRHFLRRRRRRAADREGAGRESDRHLGLGRQARAAEGRRAGSWASARAPAISATRCMQATGGKGANLVVNNVGGSVFAECVRALAFQGRLATVGYVDGVLKAEIDIEALHAKRLVLFGVSNKLRSAEQRAESARGFVADILPAIADGRIRPLIDRVYPSTNCRRRRRTWNRTRTWERSC